MPDLDRVETEAEGHEKEVEKGVDERVAMAGTDAERGTGGKDHGLVDQAEKDVEKQLGGQQGS